MARSHGPSKMRRGGRLATLVLACRLVVAAPTTSPTTASPTGSRTAPDGDVCAGPNAVRNPSFDADAGLNRSHPWYHVPSFWTQIGTGGSIVVVPEDGHGWGRCEQLPCSHDQLRPMPGATGEYLGLQSRGASLSQVEGGLPDPRRPLQAFVLGCQPTAFWNPVADSCRRRHAAG